MYLASKQLDTISFCTNTACRSLRWLSVNDLPTFVGHLSDFTKKNEKGKEKVVFQGEGIEKVVVQLSYKWGYVESI
jgi:hypothetical protein